MRVLTVTNEKSISKIVRSMFPALTEAMLRRAFRQKDFRVNGVRTGEDILLRPGDQLTVYIDDRYLLPSVQIVYADENIAVIDKPAGLLVEGESGAQGVLAQQLGHPVFAVHRLDAQTSGLVLFACTQTAEQILLDAFRERRTEKIYICVVKGRPRKPAGELRHYLRKDASRGFVQALDAPAKGALTALSEYRVLETGTQTSRVEVTLHTGRTHQIRVQMAHIGCPLVGDDKYGDRAFNRAVGAKRLLLHACKLSLHLPDGPLAYLDGRTFASPAPFEL